MLAPALIADAWQEYHEQQGKSFAVSPSIPILFFGDSQGYQSSDIRIITVGLNPSLNEFPSANPFLRFPQANGLYPAIMNGQGYESYVQALDSYFREAPYKVWFNSFEPILNGLGGSFYAGSQRTVLHTDLCSPLATNPTWSWLPESDRTLLRTSGTSLWHKLVVDLEPDIIVVSIARRYLSSISFKALRHYPAAHTISLTKGGLPRAKDYQVDVTRVAISEDKSALLVFGAAANTPFGTISTVDKVQIGKAILRLYRGG